MKKNSLWVWLNKYIFNMIGGFFLGLGIPSHHNILPIPDFVVFLPLGTLLVGMSYYYTFIHKN